MDTSGVPMTGSRTVFVLTGCSIAPRTQRFGESAEATRRISPRTPKVGESAEADTTHRADDAEVRGER
jgi:hypothetical protein